MCARLGLSFAFATSLGPHSAGILKLCDERGISVVLGGPFNSGILATGAVEGAKYYCA